MNNTLTPYGYAKDGKIYLNAYMDFPEREIGVVKESEEASLLYFIKRYELATKKVQELKDAIATTPNKGSYLMKLIHMRTYLGEFDGLGDFPVLFQELDELEADIRDYIEKNRHKNLEIKQSLLKEVENVKHSTNWMAATKKMKDLKLKWIKTGSAEKDHEEALNAEFNAALDYFFERRNKFLDEKNKIIGDRVAKYKSLVDKVRKVNDESPDNGFQTIKSVQSDWKLVGRIPKKQFGDLQKALKDEMNKFFNKNKKKPVVQKNPIDRKRELCERVEQMLELPDDAPLDEVKSIQAEWKKLGKLTHPLDREYNTRFKIACNEIFENHFLTKTARWKYESFDEKTRFEQLKIKIRLIKESIKQDETELSMFNNAAGKTRVGGTTGSKGFGTPNPDEKTMDINQINQINKLKTKQRILRKLQDQLLTNY